MKEMDRGERKMNESEGTEEIKTSLPLPTASLTVSQYQLDAPVT